VEASSLVEFLAVSTAEAAFLGAVVAKFTGFLVTAALAAAFLAEAAASTTAFLAAA